MEVDGLLYVSLTNPLPISKLLVIMQNQELFYYIQLLFKDRKERDRTYGIELYPDPIPKSSSTHGTLEVLYKRKGSNKTGARKWYGFQERLPTIVL